MLDVYSKYMYTLTVSRKILHQSIAYQRGEMKTVSVREAREKISSLLDAVTAGENIVITRRGKPVAQLTNIDPGETRIQFPDRTSFRKQISSSEVSSGKLIRSMRDERG